MNNNVNLVVIVADGHTNGGLPFSSTLCRDFGLTCALCYLGKYPLATLWKNQDYCLNFLLELLVAETTGDKYFCVFERLSGLFR